MQFFKKKESRKWTLDGTTENEINFVITDKINM